VSHQEAIPILNSSCRLGGFQNKRNEKPKAHDAAREDFSVIRFPFLYKAIPGNFIIILIRQFCVSKFDIVVIFHLSTTFICIEMFLGTHRMLIYAWCLYLYTEAVDLCQSDASCLRPYTCMFLSSQIRGTDFKWQCSYPLKATFVFPVDEIVQGPVLHIIHSSLPIISVIVLLSHLISHLGHTVPFF
jgi:hypothetical protein